MPGFLVLFRKSYIVTLQMRLKQNCAAPLLDICRRLLCPFSSKIVLHCIFVETGVLDFSIKGVKKGEKVR